MSIVGAIDNKPAYWLDSNADPVLLKLGGFGLEGGASGINNLGQIVGLIRDGNNITKPVYWSNSNADPVLLSFGGLGVDGEASGINSLGQIVGRIVGRIYAKAVYWENFNADPVLLSSGEGGGSGYASDINSLGQIVGKTITRGLVYWADYNAEPVSLLLGIVNGYPRVGINNFGQIVGKIDVNTFNKGGYWTNYTAEPVPLNISGSILSIEFTASGINNFGQIVGQSINTGQPVYWSNYKAEPVLLKLGGLGVDGSANGISDPPLISNICFPRGTPIQTDQGGVHIDRLNPARHTINNQPILHITQTVSLDKYLISFEPHALMRNVPHTKTLMSKDHKIMFEGRLVPAERFLNYSEKVKKVKYTGEILYNVLLDTYATIQVNGLICETLHPDNSIALLYKNKFSEVCKQLILSKNKEAVPVNKRFHINL